MMMSFICSCRNNQTATQTAIQNAGAARLGRSLLHLDSALLLLWLFTCARRQPNSFLAPSRRTSSLLAAHLRFLRQRPVFDTQCNPCLSYLAGRRLAALGLRVTCIRRDASSGRPLATFFGGLHHFNGLFTNDLS